MKGMLEEIYRKRELRLDHASFEDILRKLGRIKADTAYVPAMTDPTPRRILADVAAAGISEADLSIPEELLQRQKAVIGLDFHDRSIMPCTCWRPMQRYGASGRSG